MLRRIAPVLLLAVLASCSSPADNSLLPPGPDARGAALGPNGAFAVTTRLAWSAATNEIVGNGAAAGGALVAMDAATGSLRSIDSDAPLTVRLSDDGSTVVYDAFENGPDTLGLRRAALGGGANGRVTYALGLSPHAFAVDRSGGQLAWSRQSVFDIEPESIRVEVYPVPAAPGAARAVARTARLATLEPGTPVVFSPGGQELLYHPGSNPSALSRWSSVTLVSTPFALGLPGGARGTALRWDAAGVKALYAIGSRQLWLRNATLPGDAPLLVTPGDSILAASPTWSPDGAKAAVWTVAYLSTLQVTQGRLYVVDIATASAAVVAIGTETPGAITFSPDSKRVSYLFGTQLRVANVPGAGPLVAAAPRPAAARRR